MEMTVRSQEMYDKAMHIHSVAQAREELMQTGNFHTLGDILRESCGPSPKQELVDGLMDQEPSARRESIDRKVRNWLNGRTNSLSKEDAFRLSLILKLNLRETDTFLRSVTGEGIHWRSPEDVVWAYGVSNGCPYWQILRLLDQTGHMKEQVKLQNRQLPVTYTEAVAARLIPALSLPEPEFLAVLEELAREFGTFHNTAYRLFMQYMLLLETGGADSGLSPEHKMTTQDILEKYLFRKLLPVAKQNEQRSKEAFTDIQRSIRANWPDEATLSKMKHREIDVTRKVLILLFLATDGYEAEDPDGEEDDFCEEDEEELTRDERFENVYARMNRMLRSCGFQLLDARSPFDWLILCCISVDDLWNIDRLMKAMLSAIFPLEQEETP